MRDVSRVLPHTGRVGETAERRLEYVPLEELVPAERNPKRHDLEALGRSFAAFGYVEPVVIDERTGRLVAGHGRLEELRALQVGGGAAPEGVTIGDGGAWLVPALRGWSSVDDIHAEAYLAASNRLVELGGWDTEALVEMLADLQASDAALLGSAGFTAADLALLRSQAPRPRLTDPDDAPPPTVGDPITSVGDVWLLGPHRLAVGSATDPAVHAAVCGDAPVDLLLTDPPYGVSYVGSGGKRIANDDLRGEELRALVRDATSLAHGRLRPGGPFYVFGPSGDQQLPFRLALEDAGLRVRQECVWVKNHFVMGRSDWQAQHESVLAGGDLWDREFDVALYGWRDGAAHHWDGGRRLTTVWEFDKPGASVDHPTMKPVAMLEQAIAASCPPEGLVFDPFAGSGSTLIACHGTGRRAAVIELDPGYADVICRRWQAHTGIVPVLEATGAERDFTVAVAA